MPKSIDSSVGVGGRNVSLSVMTVQFLLNCVPAGRGGPVPELAVDGIVGPKTIAAIRKFQSANLGFADGRVDPGGKTIAALGAYDPYPNQPMGPGFLKSPASLKDPFLKDPFLKDPFAKDAYGKSPFGKDAYGKSPFGKTAYGKSPFGKDPFGKLPPPGKGW